MNLSIILGNLTKDVEKTTTPNGISVARFTVAVQRKFKNASGEKETDFIPVVCFRDLADLCAKYLLKGKKVAVTGAIQVRNYEAKDGTKRYTTEILADNVEFLSPTEKEPKKTIDDLPPIEDDDDLPF